MGQDPDTLGQLIPTETTPPSAAELRHQRSAMVRGPALLTHIAAGNIPNPTLFSMTLGLVIKSAQFIKCASRASLLPRLYAHSLAATESKLGACLEIAAWPGGSENLEEALFLESDCVTATGSDETLRSIRNRLPLRTRFLGYGSRLSFGYIAEDALSTYAVKRLARDAAADVSAWNQMGCLSPHVFYVEPDGVVSPEGFAEKLAQELAACEVSMPRGEVSLEESAHISQRRAVYEARAAFAASAPAERNRSQSVFFEAAHTPTPPTKAQKNPPLRVG